MLRPQIANLGIIYAPLAEVTWESWGQVVGSLQRLDSSCASEMTGINFSNIWHHAFTKGAFYCFPNINNGCLQVTDVLGTYPSTVPPPTCQVRTYIRTLTLPGQLWAQP